MKEIAISDCVYVVRKSNQVKCPLCGGAKKVLVIGTTWDTTPCYKCNGKGEITVSDEDAKYVVSSMIVTKIEKVITLRGTVTRFWGRDKDLHLKRVNHDNWFTNFADAQERCDYLNLERKTVPIDEITIMNSFKRKMPCNEKMNARFNEWRHNNKCETEICVDENNVLFDGYTAYLTYKMFGVNEIPIVVFPTNKVPEKYRKMCADAKENHND